MKAFWDLDQIAILKQKIPSVDELINETKKSDDPMQIICTSMIVTKSGKIKDRDIRKGQSLLRGYMLMLMAQFSGTTSISTANDTGGTPRTTAVGTSTLNVNGLATTGSKGIVIGTGVNAVTKDDFKLQTQILQGATSGLVLHGDTGVGGLIQSLNQCWFNITRNFSNASGGTLSIEEVGLYGSGSSQEFCIDRTLKSDTFLDGTQLIKTYTPIITV